MVQWLTCKKHRFVITKIVRTAVPSIAVRAPVVEHTGTEVSSQTPPVTHEGHNASTEKRVKSLKGKKGTAPEEGTEHKKRR